MIAFCELLLATAELCTRDIESPELIYSEPIEVHCVVGN